MVDVEKYVKIVTGSRDSVQAEESNEVLDEVRWGNIIGSISDQADLYGILESKVSNSELATVATSGNYNDLTNKPIIPAAQVQADWDEVDSSKVDYIKNKPSLANVATSGDYDDLTNKPTIPAAQVNADWSASSGVAEILNKPTTLAGYGITDGANTDLSNLTSTGKNISNWSSNVTNCIVSVAQDIKLELSSGTLTLKAGSKVYVPNGVGVFDTITIASDLTITDNQSRTLFIGLNTTGTGLIKCVGSETGTPVAGTYKYYYDPTANKCYQSGAGSTPQASFPIAIVTATSADGIVSIDQIFNGFGFIGSTVFVLPSVKGLIPNGFNTDGTLASLNVSVDEIQVLTLTTETLSGAKYWVTATGVSGGFNQYIQYNKELNRVIYNVDGTSREYCDIGIISSDNGKILSFKPKLAFEALDYNDTGFIAHQGMPSDRYIDLTLGASQTYYTAPADGYFFIIKNGLQNEYCNLYLVPANSNDRLLGNAVVGNVSGALGSWIAAKKGQRAWVVYTASGTLAYFRFVYAEGAQ